MTISNKKRYSAFGLISWSAGFYR